MSTGDGDGDGDDDRDAGSQAGSGGSDQPELDASSGGSASADASDPDRPSPPTEDGVHISVDGDPYETANDVFYFEAPRPGIQAEFRTTQLRVGMTATPGVFTCDDGATIDYDVGDGQFTADAQLGSCTVDIEEFGGAPGDAIIATVHGVLERTRGEVADSVELDARIQVAHP